MAFGMNRVVLLGRLGADVTVNHSMTGPRGRFQHRHRRLLLQPRFEILRATMNRAEEWGLCERGSNPCLGTAKNPRNHVSRFLDRDDLARLGRALVAHEARRGPRPSPRSGCWRSPDALAGTSGSAQVALGNQRSYRDRPMKRVNLDDSSPPRLTR